MTPEELGPVRLADPDHLLLVEEREPLGRWAKLGVVGDVEADHRRQGQEDPAGRAPGLGEHQPDASGAGAVADLRGLDDRGRDSGGELEAGGFPDEQAREMCVRFHQPG